MKSKYFNFKGRMMLSRYGQEGQPEESIDTVDKAWEKTLEKWALIMGGYTAVSQGSTCGLCNYVDRIMGSCHNCPVYDATGGYDCIPFNGYAPDLQYLYLLIIKEAYYSGWDRRES